MLAQRKAGILSAKAVMDRRPAKGFSRLWLSMDRAGIRRSIGRHSAARCAALENLRGRCGVKEMRTGTGLHA